MNASEHISPDLQSAYLLGACTEGEARVAREHLTGCNACARSLDQLRPARAALLEAAPVRSAPAHLKDAVMAEVRREAELFDAAKAPASNPAARPRLWERLRSPLPALGLAAAAALVVVVGVTGSVPGPLAPTVTVSDGEVDSRRAPRGNARLETEDGRVRLSVAGLPGPGPRPPVSGLAAHRRAAAALGASAVLGRCQGLRERRAARRHGRRGHRARDLRAGWRVGAAVPGADRRGSDLRDGTGRGATRFAP